MPRRVPRKPSPKKTGVPKGYDSIWEADLHKTILQEWKHHWGNIDYVVAHKYEPDFVKTLKNKTILLEAKGRFWDYAEYSKYIHVRKALPKWIRPTENVDIQIIKEDRGKMYVVQELNDWLLEYKKR